MKLIRVETLTPCSRNRLHIAISIQKGPGTCLAIWSGA